MTVGSSSANGVHRQGEGGPNPHDLWRNRPIPPDFFHGAKLGFPLQARAHGDPGT
jgi:hypothetical protein